MGPTDGNLYALAKYQEQYDRADAYAETIERICEDRGVDEEEAAELLARYEDDRAEALAEARADALMDRMGW